jgi:hypothetical protein
MFGITVSHITVDPDKQTHCEIKHTLHIRKDNKSKEKYLFFQNGRNSSCAGPDFQQLKYIYKKSISFHLKLTSSKSINQQKKKLILKKKSETELSLTEDEATLRLTTPNMIDYLRSISNLI